MILKLFRRTLRDDTIARLYGTIVAQARAPAFYQLYGVPDTVNGRLEMVMLHTVLFLRRLEGEIGPVRQLGVFAGGGDRGGANRLAVYVRETERRLAAEDGFEGAQFAFPDPEEVFVRAPQPTVEQ